MWTHGSRMLEQGKELVSGESEADRHHREIVQSGERVAAMMAKTIFGCVLALCVTMLIIHFTSEC